MTGLQIPSSVPSNHGFLLADEYEAGFITEGHKDGSSNARHRDGRDVGIGSIFGPRRAVLAYERRLPVDNRVGMRGSAS
jgi:hypothetical protein